MFHSFAGFTLKCQIGQSTITQEYQIFFNETINHLQDCMHSIQLDLWTHQEVITPL